jgi:hypothetical protein
MKEKIPLATERIKGFWALWNSIITDAMVTLLRTVFLYAAFWKQY